LFIFDYGIYNYNSTNSGIAAHPINLPQPVEKFAQMSIAIPVSPGGRERGMPDSQGDSAPARPFNSIWQGILTDDTGKHII
jgi:hypothetical protein